MNRKNCIIESWKMLTNKYSTPQNDFNEKNLDHNKSHYVIFEKGLPVTLTMK